MKTHRELAAILFSDVSDFTNTMGTDENMAMDQILRHKEIVSRALQDYNGQLIKDMGDGLFVKFSSAVESVICAIRIQQLTNLENFSIRIGIHLGDVIHKDSDVFGSGVNIASRIQTASHPGSICISKEIWIQVKNQEDIKAKSLGKKTFKGVDEKIEVYELLNEQSPTHDAMHNKKIYSSVKNKLFPVTGFLLTIIGGIFWVAYSFFDIGFTNSPYSTSIAILELKNISTADNSFFAEGLTEELIAKLSKINNLNVTPRTDIDRYKNSDMSDTKKIAKELGVEYIFEGSVRISGLNLSVIANLINPLDRKLIWSATYNDNLSNILDVQDKIARQIVSELNQKIVKDPLLDEHMGGIYPGGRRMAKSIAAVEYVSEAYNALQNTKYSNIENAKYSNQFLIRALHEDSTYGEAYALLALSQIMLISNFSDTEKIEKKLANIDKHVDLALHYDKENRLALAEKVELLNIMSSKNQLDYSMRYDRIILNNVADKLLENAISSYLASERKIL